MLDHGWVVAAADYAEVAEVADDSCVFDIVGALVNPRMGAFFRGDPTAEPAWRKQFIANQAPLPPAGIPVFIGHGLDDPLIDPGFSVRLAQRYCAAGAAVETHWMPGVGHINSSIAAAPAYIDWLAGGEAPSNCGDKEPVAAAVELH